MDESQLEGWYLESTGEQFDPNNPIVQDLAVVARRKGGDTTLQRVAQELIPILIIAGLFLILLWMSIKRVKRDGYRHEKCR